ncbi:MAG: hypothetical protein H0T53_17210 [Herpetosiphonaceae bacterium]|nr:hypothetical protein [Herpetosiphonaceae bacterium]
MADLCIDLATGKRQQTKVDYQWDSLLTARVLPKANAAPKKTTRKAKAAENNGEPAAKPARKTRAKKTEEA